MSVQRGRFLEIADIVVAFAPVDTQTGDNPGDWVNMGKFGRCLWIGVFNAGTGSDTPVVTPLQAKDNTGTSSKAVNFDTIWTKIGAFASTPNFTKVVQALAATYTPGSPTSPKILALEVRAENLDVEGGFSFFSVDIPDTGAAGALLGCGIYVMLDPRFEGAAIESAQS